MIDKQNETGPTSEGPGIRFRAVKKSEAQSMIQDSMDAMWRSGMRPTGYPEAPAAPAGPAGPTGAPGATGSTGESPCREGAVGATGCCAGGLLEDDLVDDDVIFDAAVEDQSDLLSILSDQLLSCSQMSAKLAEMVGVRSIRPRDE